MPTPSAAPAAADRMSTTYHIYWAPEGKRIATVKAKDARAAKRKAPMPYRKYLGEIYVVTAE